MPSTPLFRPGGVHAGRNRTNPTGHAGGFGSTPKPPTDVNFQLLAPRPTGPTGSFLRSASGRLLSRRCPAWKSCLLLYFNSYCHASTTPNRSLRLLCRHSFEGDLRSLSRVVSHNHRPATSRFRLHLKIRGTIASSLPTDPSRPPPDCQKIPLRPILRHCGFPLTNTSRLGGHAVLRHLVEDTCSDPHEVDSDFCPLPMPKPLSLG